MSPDPRDITDVFARGELCHQPDDGLCPSPPFPDPSRTVSVELPLDGAPPLILVSDRRLSARAFRNLSDSIKLAAESRTPVIIADAGLTFFQHVDGQWRPLR